MSATPRLHGHIGTPAMLIGVGAVVVAQLAFTYAPPLQFLFATMPLDPISDGLPILGTGVVLLVVLELEKTLRRVTRRG